MNYKTALFKNSRLDILKDNSKAAPITLLDIITSSGMTSPVYGFQNMRLDLWYLYRPRYKSKTQKLAGICSSSERIVLLQIIIQALKDFATARPCDHSIWTHDMSPVRSRCNNIAHICSEEAELFLVNITKMQEDYAGLSSGTVKEYMRRIKKDRSSILSFNIVC